MVASKAPRASRVFIRAWLAELLNVNAQTLSMWISQGQLRSYEPEDVKEFLLAHPRTLERAARGEVPDAGPPAPRRGKAKPAVRPSPRKPSPRKTARPARAARPAAKKATRGKSSGQRRGSSRKN